MNVSSIRHHYSSVKKFINDHVGKVPESTFYHKLADERLFYIVYWIVHLSLAISPRVLYGCVKSIVQSATDHDIRNKIYCMQLAKWIAVEPYSDKDYFYALHDSEPFLYSYKDGVADTSLDRRKLTTRGGLQRAETLPSHIRRIAAAARVAKS